MTKIKIVTDSTCDLSNEEIERFNIEIVPLTINIDGETYRDRIDITPSEFMMKMKKSIELPKTSQPSSGLFLEVYDRLGTEGYDVISIHLTGKMSGTVNSAEGAASMTNTNVKVVDSEFISKALSFQVLEAAKMAIAGKTVESIMSRLEEIRKQSRLYIVVDTLENLSKGGRIGKGAAMVGSLLNIKPIASLENGEYTPVAKVRSHAQAAKYIAKHFAEDVKEKVIKEVALVHADGHELAMKIKEAIKEKTGYDQMKLEETTPVISTHTGPGAIGFMYFVE
ncbi:DegV family protein [Niallia sp. Krafla_26]|uniref:DegV family protein n=1 Tax=Niallia sp. Krafla_26 TaxID=3064703 RepID=UPI003D178659